VHVHWTTTAAGAATAASISAAAMGFLGTTRGGWQFKAFIVVTIKGFY